MGRGRKYQPEQVVNLLRQIEVAVANGKTTAQASKEAGIVEQTYFRWRKEYGGLRRRAGEKGACPGSSGSAED
jgi:putative transposase